MLQRPAFSGQRPASMLRPPSAMSVMPVPYAATAEDLANLFVFLASDESRMINGQLIRVDGGLLSKMPYFETYRDALDQSATPYEKLAG